MGIRPVKIFILSVLAVSFLYAQTAYSEETAVTGSANNGSDYLKSMINMIQEEHKGDITDKKLMEGALKGMFSTMDPYTEFYTAEEAESFLNTFGGSFSGIGVVLSQEDDGVVIEEILSGSPAEKAGILAGDKIAEVDGKAVTKLVVDDVSELIKGESGTIVVIGLIREGETGIKKIEVKRDIISINPVSYKINNGIGYIKISIFNGNLDENLTKALEEMDKSKITKIILDLRDNPGGEVSQAVAAARKFVPEGLITKLDFKSEDRKDEEYYSYLKETKYKVAVLVNGNSASSSEILTGAIQDAGAGTIIGTKTYGKAKVQNLFPLLTQSAFEKYKTQFGVSMVNVFDLEKKYGASVQDDEVIGWTKITTGLYTTPKGRMIDTVGIEPDIHIENLKSINDVDISNVGKLKKRIKPVLNAENTEVENAEKILKMCGYFKGTPDNKFDRDTMEAVKRFQKDSKLFSYGILDFTTQQALNDKLDNLVMEADKQYTEAVKVLNKE